MSQQEFENYLELLCRLLKIAPDQRRQVAEEFRAHLEDRLDELTARGMEHHQAVQQAIGEFGDAAVLAAELAEVAQKRRRRLIMKVSYASVAALAAIGLLAFALWPENRQVPGPKQAVAQVAPEAPAANPVQQPLDAEAAAKRRIEEALGQTIDLQFQDAPLAQAIADVAKKAGIPIRAAYKALEEAAINPDTPINFSIDGVSLRSALRLMLGDLGLTYVVRNEVLLITTPEDAESELITRVYDCRELLAMATPPGSQGERWRTPPQDPRGALDGEIGSKPSAESNASSPVEGAKPASGEPPVTGGGGFSGFGDGEGHDHKVDFNLLIRVITTTVEPETWDEVGGPGSIAEYKGLLAVSATGEVHEKVERLLNMLHRAAGLKEQRVKVVE